MSNKSNDKSIFIGLKIIAVLVFAVAFFPVGAQAEVCIASSFHPCYNISVHEAPVISNLNPNPVNRGSAPFALTIQGDNFIPGAVVRFNGYSRQTNYLDSGDLAIQINSGDTANAGNYSVTVTNPDGQVSNEVYLAVNRTLVTGTNGSANSHGTSNSGSSGSTSSTSNTSSTSSTNLDTSTASNLASNAIFGANTFLPSGLMQWILFGIFVLLIIILWRRIFIHDKTPMKHA